MASQPIAEILFMEQLGEIGQRVQMPYFDDVLHRALGLTGHDWQNLYHFTIGAPVEDLRLRTAPPHAHLERAD
jgi:hypothetical protein